MFSTLDRRRGPPLSPSERFKRNVKFKSLTDQQRGSSLFITLPNEIRRMIYIELFGSQLVHIYFRRHGEKYWRDDAPSDAKIPGWVHCVCRRGHEAVPHYHEEKNHKLCYLSTNILRACQLAYEEGIPILYQTNILSFRSCAEVSFFDAHVVHFSNLAVSIDLYVAEENYGNQHPWAVKDLMSHFKALCYHSGVLISCKNARFYFDDSVDCVGIYIRMLDPLRCSSPIHQHFFLPGGMTEDVHKQINLYLAEETENRIVKVTLNAKELLSDCYGELSDEGDEDYLPSSSGTDDSDTEDEDSEIEEVEGPSYIML